MEGTEFSLRVKDFAQSDISDEVFREKNGSGFLLHFGDLGAVPTVSHLGKTAFAAPPSEIKRPEPGATFMVFPIRLSGRTAFTDFVSIGRANNNDIVLHDASVSSFHALIQLRKSADGAVSFFLQDGGSKNGTYVEERRAPGPDSREFIALDTSGVVLRLGEVQLTFMLIPEFRRLLRGVRK